MTAAATVPTDLTFEAALVRLEAIVRELENGTIPLEQALARFEEGTRLARFCRERLLAAEARVVELLADGGLREIPIEKK